MRQRCFECNHVWFYSGKDKYVTCPNCYNYWKLTPDEWEEQQMQIFGYIKDESDEKEQTNERNATDYIPTKGGEQ